MVANKDKQNLRYKKAASRIDKKERYDGFTKEEVKIIKLQHKFDKFDKEINNFWAYAPRNENNSVAWDKMNDQEISLFEHINGEKQKALKLIMKFEDNGYDTDEIMKRFVQLNIRSTCY